MSPLLKYYGALALAAAALALLCSRTLSGAALIVDLAVGSFGFIYAFFVARCPKCRSYFINDGTPFSRGAPGRYCRVCEHDLVRGKGQISN
jgi:hypothetical protein